MPPAAAVIFLTVALDLDALAQMPPSEQSTTPASPAWTLGRPHTRGLAFCSDRTTLSIELADQRVIRFQLDGKTRYAGDSGPGTLASFHMADFIQVESEVDTKGFLLAHSVRFVRERSPGEVAGICKARS